MDRHTPKYIKKQRGQSEFSEILSDGSPLARQNEFVQRPICVKIPSSGGHYCLYGPSSSYSTTYPNELHTYMTMDEYMVFINRINNKILENWPPNFIFVLGWLCAPCTAFLSLQLPVCCLKDTTKYLVWALEEQNILWEERHIKASWHRKQFKSWIQLDIAAQYSKQSIYDLDGVIENFQEGSSMNRTPDRLKKKEKDRTPKHDQVEESEMDSNEVKIEVT